MTNEQIMTQVLKETEAAEEATRTATAIVSTFLQSIDKATHNRLMFHFADFLDDIVKNEDEKVNSNLVLAVAEIMASNIDPVE